MDWRDPEDPLEDGSDQYPIEEVNPDTDSGWTTRSDQAVDEAMPYMPPEDPPVLPSGDQGAAVAAGWGPSAEDPPFRGDASTRDDWIAQQVERVLREDAGTSKLPLSVNVNDGAVFLHGFVTDEADAELAETVAAQVPGVTSVEDRTEVRPDVVEHTVMELPREDEEG
ncbi:MAG TPA: BON domain-containing protein [Chloroflexota bacterium]|nr:BON domain-containing protein [Chloroflexota bacterium]